MSTVTRSKPTSMLVCDLCDEEILRDADGSAGRANLMTNVSPVGRVTERTPWALLCWGRRRLNSERDPIPTASYDFHGKCIADLVEREIKTRCDLSREEVK